MGLAGSGHCLGWILRVSNNTVGVVSNEDQWVEGGTSVSEELGTSSGALSILMVKCRGSDGGWRQKWGESVISVGHKSLPLDKAGAYV